MSVPTEEQTGYLNTLEDTALIIQKVQTNLKKCPKQRLTEGYVKTRMKTIEDYWTSFKHAHVCLTRCTPREQRGELKYFLNEDYFIFEDIYTNLQADLADLLASLQSRSQFKQITPGSTDVSMSSPHTQNAFATLPKIQLPTFSGRYEDWPTYQDLFTALVHNTSLSNVQKLHYLKSSVAGEAEMLLRHIQITDSNYTQAWQILKGRFDNKKMIVNSLLERLFGQKKVSNQSSSQIKALLDTTTECLHSLNNLKILTDSWDPVVVFLVAQKLDTESLKDWEEYAHKESSYEISKWDEMRRFLESKFRTLELIAPSSTSSRDKPLTHKTFHATTDEYENDICQTAHAKVSSRMTCMFCKGEHHIFACKDFAKQTVEQRQGFVRNNNLCFNCLIPNHNVYRCKQRTTCRICGRRHHSLLHQTRETTQETTIQPEQTITTAHFSKNQPGQQVLLATAQVEVKARDGSTHLLRALIDQGSEASFVSARAVELLGLLRTDINGVASGVGEGTQIPLKHLVEMSVKSIWNTDETVKVKAYVLKTISTKLPSRNITMDSQHLQTLNLADPTYYKPGAIDMLLGAEVFCKIIENGLIKLPDGVVAQKTMLGWILSGQREETEKRNEHNMITLHITRMVAEDNDMLRKFWEIETEIYKKKKLFTKEEEKCEKIYNESTKRDEEGRYIVQLPLKQNIEETVNLCGDTKQQATTRFNQLERKFERNTKLKEEYTKVIHEYMEMGHMKESQTPDNEVAIYLPHHAVIRADKDTSQVRVVYDASMKGANGHSLNDTMMVGPVLQPDLRSLITTWRTHKVCVVGDIKKMYRMVRMTEEHTDLQRIVWRDDPSEDLKSYNLTTVTLVQLQLRISLFEPYTN